MENSVDATLRLRSGVSYFHRAILNLRVQTLIYPRSKRISFRPGNNSRLVAQQYDSNYVRFPYLNDREIVSSCFIRGRFASVLRFCIPYISIHRGFTASRPFRKKLKMESNDRHRQGVPKYIVIDELGFLKRDIYLCVSVQTMTIVFIRTCYFTYIAIASNTLVHSFVYSQ